MSYKEVKEVNKVSLTFCTELDNLCPNPEKDCEKCLKESRDWMY